MRTLLCRLLLSAGRPGFALLLILHGLHFDANYRPQIIGPHLEHGRNNQMHSQPAVIIIQQQQMYTYSTRTHIHMTL